MQAEKLKYAQNFFIGISADDVHFPSVFLHLFKDIKDGYGKPIGFFTISEWFVGCGTGSPR